MKQLLIFLFLFLLSFAVPITTNKLSNSTDKTITVYVDGAVTTSDTVELPYGSTFQDLLDVITLNEDADISVFNTLLPLKNNDMITIPTVSDSIKISINTATLEELCLLPGIGEKTAKKIITYRNENGLFQKLEELKNVKGIGETKYLNLLEFICL